MNTTLKHSWRTMRQFFSACLLLACVMSVKATDALYQNFDALYYTTSGNPPPTLDVTAFDNENIFSISYDTYTPGISYYQTRNTINFTNNGTMIVNGPSTLFGFLSSFGTGFNFDNWTTNVIPHRMAGTFFNLGDIRCNSTNDVANGFTSVDNIGKCLVNATNIISHGAITVGYANDISLTAKYADLTLGQFYHEPSQLSFILTGNTFNFFQNSPGVTGTGAIGTDTNLDWNPAVALNANTAYSSFPFFLFLTNSTPYMDVVGQGTSNVVIRAVFVQNATNSVPYQVYFGQNNFGNGAATIEWAGSYRDPASGDNLTNYLYLNNDYVFGADTNNYLINGVPANFRFTKTTASVAIGPAAPSGLTFNFQPNAPQTNRYAYTTAQLISSAVATNASNINPSGAISNTIGRVVIIASNELSLAGAQISGQNYLSLTAPVQFNGSQAAQIISPYSDINLGVTNGNLEIANLISSGTANWNGTVQAWSTRYFYTDAGGVTYDYRVMLVASDLSPLSKSWVQYLRLHATNSLVLRDVMNVYGSLNIDAQRLTIETNGVGNGYNSIAGELNWLPLTVLNAVQLPNLLWLTNNGALRAGNTAIFGTSSSRYGAFINNGFVGTGGATIWTTNFSNSGVITNGTGSFVLQTSNAVMTNGSIYAGGDLTIATPSLVFSNGVISAGRSLTLSVTNLISDNGPGNGAAMSVGAVGVGTGLILPVKPPTGDLLGTSITDYAPGSKVMLNQWSGLDYGYTNSGYNNNVAVGRLILDSLKGGALTYGKLNFSGTGTNNAMYVDQLILLDYASYTNRNGTNLPAITFNPTNMVIYYAMATLADGTDVSEKIDHFNTNHFRWMPSYVGYFSSTNLVYPPGVTNTVNAGLARSTTIDSDNDGIPNAADPTPFFLPSQLNFTITKTNPPANSVRLQWQTIPNATNYIFYKTNLASPTWLPFTDFTKFYYGNNVGTTNAAHVNWFASPLAYPTNPPINDLRTNVWVLDGITNTAKFYRVLVQ